MLKLVIFSGAELGFTRFEISSASARARLQPPLHHVPPSGQCNTMCIQPPLPQQPPWAAAAPHRTGDAVAAPPPPQQIPFMLLLCQRNSEGNRTSTAWRACLANYCSLSCWQSKASHTVSPPMEGQDPALDFRALYSVGNSPLSRSLPCTALSIKYRGGCPVPAWLWQCPRVAAGTAPPNLSKPRRKIPALSGQTLISRKRHAPSLPVMASSKEPVHPTSLAPQPLSHASWGDGPFPLLPVSVDGTFSP